MSKITAAQRALLDDLAGTSDIAQALGVTRGLVSVWTTRYADFPAPVVELAAGKVWRLSEVRAWHEGRFTK